MVCYQPLYIFLEILNNFLCQQKVLCWQYFNIVIFTLWCLMDCKVGDIQNQLNEFEGVVWKTLKYKILLSIPCSTIVCLSILRNDFENIEVKITYCIYMNDRVAVVIPSPLQGVISHYLQLWYVLPHSNFSVNVAY